MSTKSKAFTPQLSTLAATIAGVLGLPESDARKALGQTVVARFKLACERDLDPEHVDLTDPIAVKVACKLQDRQVSRMVARADRRAEQDFALEMELADLAYNATLDSDTLMVTGRKTPDSIRADHAKEQAKEQAEAPTPTQTPTLNTLPEGTEVITPS